jgi:Tol biopolymer transport system component
VSLWASPLFSQDGHRASYYKNGEIHVNVLGTPETKPITSGHWDFKPSWSKTGDMLVFFRRLKDDPDVNQWVTAMCIINADGSGFHQLSDGTYTDFNPTWTRDGTNTPVWNRKHPEKLSYYIMASKVGAKPGEEIQLTDKSYHAWVHSAVRDGRLLVSATPPGLGRGYYLMTPSAGGKPKFERIECELAANGILDRISVSPSETKICFEYQAGFNYEFPGRTLYVADFDAKRLTIANVKPFANAEAKRVWFAYPRWTKDESTIVYHAGGKLFLYTLANGSTRQVSTDDKADYRYPHGEATPN